VLVPARSSEKSPLICGPTWTTVTCSLFFQDEAERWKERGKILIKEGNFELVIKYYTLAIKFTPVEEFYGDLRSMLLSNRCFAYNKMKKYFEALADAKECVRINPNWSKVSSFLPFFVLSFYAVCLNSHLPYLLFFCRVNIV
jgi:tetratricopeptide (TPR) repeat protein